MVRTDGSSPAQLFFGRNQKQNLPTFNPTAKSFCLDSMIKKRGKLHQQRIHSRDQHSVTINDLVPCQKVLIQDYITGLWSESAIVLEVGGCQVPAGTPLPPPSWDSLSEFIYIGKVGPNCRDHLQQQHQGTRPHRASSIIAIPNPAPATDSCDETQRQIRRGRARLLRADVDIRSIKKSTSQLYSSASVLLNRTEDCCIRDPVLGHNCINYLIH